MFVVLVEDDQVIDVLCLPRKKKKKLVKSYGLTGQIFPLDTAGKNKTSSSSETICAILVTIGQKRLDCTAGGTEKGTRDYK